jgi:LPXTG-motif cell wall-anchored protein
VAQAPPEQPALAPVAERKELAQTGLDPGLIALLGALCLAGGGLLFRRALARG